MLTRASRGSSVSRSHARASVRTLRALVVLYASVSALGCRGAVDSGPERPAGSGRPTDGPGFAGMSPAETTRQQDEAMRSDDPELFGIASQYFPGTTSEGAPARLSRLTRIQLDRTVQALLPAYVGGSALTTLPRDPLQTNYEYAENLGFNSANFTPFTDWVRGITDKVLAKPQGVIDCSAQADSSACLEQTARAFVQRSARQVVSDAQLRRSSEFFLASVREVGLAQATADLVAVTLTSPAFVFRDEVPGAGGGSLSAAQWAQSLSYTLADAPPEALGLAPEDAAKLAGDQALREQLIDRLLAAPDARRKLQRFFLAWLEVKEPAEFTISPELFPEFTPQLAAAMVEETRAFLEHVLGGANPSLKQVTQATQSLVSQGLRSIYGLDRVNEGALTTLDPTQRLGIFTQPAVIASHSGPSTTRLVKRGVFFTRKVMCQPLGAPPQGVDTSIPEVDDSTERQRIETGTASASCQGCHQFINPFGFMQENYDPIGRWRTRDQNLPINAAVSVAWLDPPLSANGPVEALQKLSSSARFQQCFVRQLFRFYLGRDERSGDDPVLRQMFFQLAKGDTQDIVSMLRTLAGSSALWARKAP
jgi:Protein of unknown function (DUF1588)/Protein of unknown function (DUF1592)/Protein of unknown function (DUF1585)